MRTVTAVAKFSRIESESAALMTDGPSVSSRFERRSGLISSLPRSK